MKTSGAAAPGGGFSRRSPGLGRSRRHRNRRGRHHRRTHRRPDHGPSGRGRCPRDGPRRVRRDGDCPPSRSQRWAGRVGPDLRGRGRGSRGKQGEQQRSPGGAIRGGSRACRGGLRGGHGRRQGVFRRRQASWAAIRPLRPTRPRTTQQKAPASRVFQTVTTSRQPASSRGRTPQPWGRVSDAYIP